MVGFWAEFAPRSFYDSFPGGGHHFISVAGAYDEHLIRDVGGLFLSLLVVSVWAVVRPSVEVARLTGAAWLVFAVPHLAYHGAHLDVFDAGDQVINVVSLTATVLLALVLVAGPEPRPRSRRRTRAASGGSAALDRMIWPWPPDRPPRTAQPPETPSVDHLPRRTPGD